MTSKQWDEYAASQDAAQLVYDAAIAPYQAALDTATIAAAAVRGKIVASADADFAAAIAQATDDLTAAERSARDAYEQATAAPMGAYKASL